ncbi:uncharacterized protein LOC119374024 [Rhipicephalus sanguineus]|nr:uncharacterized protein LOC119374024 [Rhipicephalus sanguineus]
MTSVETMETDKMCFAGPPTVWNSTNIAFTSIERVSRYLLDSQTYPEKLYMGVSFEMGVNLYQLTETDTPIESAPYAPCDQFTQVGYEQVCDPHAKLKTLDNVVVESGVILDYVFFYDSWDTMKKKVDRLLKLNLRKNIAWLLYNTHFSDTPWTCSPSFDRERKLRDYLASKT